MDSSRYLLPFLLSCEFCNLFCGLSFI